MSQHDDSPVSGVGLTALAAAAGRAVESTRPDRLVDDPFAAAFVAAARPPVPLPVRTTLRDLLAAQLAELDTRAARISRLRGQLRAVLAQLGESAMPDADTFMKTLELTTMTESYFTQDQRDSLLRRTEELGREAVEALRVEALGLLTEIGRHQRAGTPVDDPHVQAMTSRVDEIGTSFHDADSRLIAAANRMWRDNGAAISRSVGLPSPSDGPDLVQYLQSARQFRLDTGP